MSRPRHLGLVGVSAEGAALCHRTICGEGRAMEEWRREEAHEQRWALAGWLCTVRDPGAETVSRFLFADELPGAPVWMETRRGAGSVVAVSQTGRYRRQAPPAGDPETAPAPG